MAEFINAHPALKPVEIVGLLFTVAMSTTVIDTTRDGKIDMIGLPVPPSVAVAIPADWLDPVIRGLEATHQTGVRYPIPVDVRHEPLLPG